VFVIHAKNSFNNASLHGRTDNGVVEETKTILYSGIIDGI